MANFPVVGQDDERVPGRGKATTPPVVARRSRGLCRLNRGSALEAAPSGGERE